MKKTYRRPQIEVAEIELTLFVCGSQDIKSSNDEITYGGVDEQGTKDPSSRRQRRDVWEDEWEEEEEEEF